MAMAKRSLQLAVNTLASARHFSAVPRRDAKIQMGLQNDLRNTHQQLPHNTKAMLGRGLFNAVQLSSRALSSTPVYGIDTRLKSKGILANPTGDSAIQSASTLSKSFRSMNFIQSILEEDDITSQRKGRDVVHVLMVKNKTFVTVTDSKGNRKTGASAGCLEDRKGRSRQSRYAAEATAEHVGRSARKMGIKSVVMRIKGFSFFRKKSKVISSWRDGYRGETVGEPSPIIYIQDVTQLPHGGCRLPKRRRT